jgi:hypothetical protein
VFFDKLFGYQYHLSATLAKRLLAQAMLVISLAFLRIVWRNITHTSLPKGFQWGKLVVEKKDIPLG